MATTMNPALQRKLQKVLEMEVDGAAATVSVSSSASSTCSVTLQDSLRHIGTRFYSTNDVTARRNLRSNIEKTTLDINLSFLAALEQVQVEVDKVEREVVALDRECSDMLQRLQHTRSNASKIIEQTQALSNARATNAAKEQLLSNFLEHFQLSAQEQAALKHQHFDREFFMALSRLQKIHNDCKVLLRTQHQKAGLEIMDILSMQQQAAFDRLYRWVQDYSTTLALPSPDVHPLMPLAIRALRDRHVLYTYCLTAVENARSKALVRNFLDALVKGGPNGVPKPIEIHAHDPVRYVGDMLGWLHQAAASEFELITSLFRPETDDLFAAESSAEDSHHTAPQSPRALSTADSSMVADATANSDSLKLLSSIFAAVCRPFEVRLDEVLDTHPSLVVAFKLASLLDFYARTIGMLVDPKSPLPDNLLACKNKCMRAFYDVLRNASDHLNRSPLVAPADLSAPPMLTDSMTRLTEIMSVFDASLVPVAEREAEFAPALNAMIDPLLTACTISATVLVGAADMAVYMLNCLSLVQNTLAEFTFAKAKADLLGGQIEAHMDTLVEEETSLVLIRCKLANKIKTLQDWRSLEQRAPLSQVEGMDAVSLTEAMHAFEEALFDLGPTAMPQCEKLVSSVLKRTARTRIAQLIGSAYLALYEAVMDPKSEYSNASLIMRYKPEQIKTIVDGK